MNERIEALKKLATKEVWGNNPHNGSPEFDGYELDAEKFAELIVRECAQIAQEYMTRFPEDHPLTKQIKEHFGVE